jgi:hypothetical protein
MTVLNCLKSMKAWLGPLLLGFALVSFGCAQDDDSASDSSQHHSHHGGGGGGRYGHGQGGILDQSNPGSSASPVPGQ